MADDPTPEVEGGLDEPTDLEPAPGTLALAAPEDQHTRADWEEAAAAVLRKARRLGDDDADDLVWERLTRTTLDGVEVVPLGTPDDEAELGSRPERHGPWDVRAHLGGLDAPALHDAALADLEGGVTSLWLDVPADIDLATVLDGVFLDLAPTVLDCAESDGQADLARAFLAHTRHAELAPGTNLGGRGDSLVEVARLALDDGRPGLLGVVLDAGLVHDRGASDVLELGWSLALGVRALRALEAAGIAPAQAAGLIEFRYAATDEQFPTIAKLRAARQLWQRVLELCGVAPGELPAQRQHAVTSRAMMSRYDPYVNMLRTTVAAFAAGVGGADAVTVRPFDSALGVPEAFGRRIARNTSHLLVSESHVAAVTDPAGGAYAVEKLTADLVEAAWAELGRIEADGDAAFEDRLADVAARREREVAHRRRALTGLSEFPNLAETLPERAPDPRAEEVRRHGASFEALRDDPPAAPVFLATLGPVAQHTARATFASNLLAAGGVAVEPAGATADVEELLAAYEGQQVVCLAGADPTYAEWGAQAAEALRGAGARRVVVAGKPADWADDACGLGIDALEFLTRTREALA